MLARGPTQDPSQLLSQVRQQLQTIADPKQRRRLTSGAQLLAGLSFSQDVIQRLLAMSILEDSSVYQYIVRKGLAEGREQGRQLEAASLNPAAGRAPLRPAARGAAPEHRRSAAATARGAGRRAQLDFKDPSDLASWLP